MGIHRVNHDTTYFSQPQGSVQIMADLSKPNLITGGQLVAGADFQVLGSSPAGLRIIFRSGTLTRLG